MFKSVSFCLVFLVSFASSFSALAATKPPKASAPVVTTPVTQPPSTTTPPPVFKVTLSSVLNQILQAISSFNGEIDNANLVFLTDGSMQILTLQGKADANFDKDITIATATPAGTSNSQEADLLPSVVATTKDFLVHVSIVANPKDHPNSIVTTVTFVKNAKATPLEIDLTTPKKINIFNFRFASVEVVTTGLAAAKGDITVEGTCLAEQKLFSLETHTVDWKASKQCGFQGTFDRVTYKGPFKIQYVAK